MDAATKDTPAPAPIALRRRLTRAAVGVPLAVFFAWLVIIGSATLYSVWLVVGEGQRGDPLNVFLLFGLTGAVVVGLPMIVLGVIAWIVLDRTSLHTWRSGAVTGLTAAAALTILLPSLFWLIVPAGTIGGAVAVALTNRWVPKVPRAAS